jgi:nucleotide-binding universal stress UspA family protein
MSRAFAASVTLLHVLEVGDHVAEQAQSVDPLRWHMHRAEAEAALESVRRRLHGAGLRPQAVVLEGQAAERIIGYARENGVDLIVLSSHGRSGLSGWNVSSIVLKIILRAYLPVMVVRAYQPVVSELGGLRYRRLLAPLDCSRRAECVLSLATALARYYEAECLLAHVVVPPRVLHRAPLSQEDVELVSRIVERNRSEATRYLEQLASRLEQRVRSRVLEDDHPAEALHDLVDQADVDLVLFYEPIPSEIRTIQRRGRTGRSSTGKVIILITSGTRDEAYYCAEGSREKRMGKIMSWLSHE